MTIFLKNNTLTYHHLNLVEAIRKKSIFIFGKAFDAVGHTKLVEAVFVSDVPHKNFLKVA